MRVSRIRHSLAALASLLVFFSATKSAHAEDIEAAPGMNPEANGEALGDAVTPPPMPEPPASEPYTLAPGGDSSPIGRGSEPPKEGDLGTTHYWSKGKPRPFVSTAIDIGYLYFRPRVSFGYGKPFWRWVGIDANPQVSSRFIGAYAGLRAALPLFELRIGARRVWDFSQAYLAPMDAYHRLDFESTNEPVASYNAFEGEITGGFPVGPGSVLTILSGSYLTGVPDNLYVYDETLRVITKPPYIWRGRLGYAVRLGVEGKISVGVVADLLGMPGRDALVFRAGVILSAALSNHVEVLGSFVPPLISPDSIGVPGGDFAQLGVRFRWATGSPPERSMLIQDRFDATPP